MPYKSNSDLPESVTNVLPEHARTIYREAYNNAQQQYEDPQQRRGNASLEEVAHKVAWNAVKKSYEKGDDSKWHPKK